MGIITLMERGINMFNRIFSYIVVSAALSLVTVTARAETPTEPLWPILKEIHFEGKNIRENANDLLVIEAPIRAEDAAIVPISIKSLVAQTPDKYIKHIHIVIDNNPEPYSANFTLSPELGMVDISTRMRVDQYTDVRAIAEMNDGSLHMVSRFVKASGGCSAPAGKDAAAAQARLGKMQIRMRKPTVGEPVQAQVIVSHPNYTGLQFDQKLRKYIESHYVNNIVISYNDKNLITLDAGISVSEDPSIRFIFTPAVAGVIKVDIVDTKEKTFSYQKNIKS
jgi:sulfur-oxidizing protein SoxY